MTFPDDELEELLRTAMRSEADSIVPSPEGLNIVRDRIDRRGLRGTFWWRVGVSAVGAVLVAGTIVMLVPDLRDQVSQSTGISVAGNDKSEIPDTSSTGRPPAGTVPTPVVTPGGAEHPTATPTTSHKPGSVVRPTAPRASLCTTRPPAHVTASPSCAAAPPPPPAVTPTAVVNQPSPSPSPSLSPTPTPTATSTTEAADDSVPAS